MTKTIDNYINNTWTKSIGTETHDVINPATEEVLAKTPLGTTKDVDAAVGSYSYVTTVQL